MPDTSLDSPTMKTKQKYEQLQGILRDLKQVVVAYSGGVDSTFLLKAAVDTLGPDRVLACIGVSPSLARSQYDQAMDNARAMGATVKEVTVESFWSSDIFHQGTVIATCGAWLMESHVVLPGAVYGLCVLAATCV